LSRSGLKHKFSDTFAVCDGSKSEVRNSSHAFYRKPLTMHASQARRRILGHKQCKLPARRPVFSKVGFVQILSLGKSGTPPCKSGQLEKDLGLEASSLRHAARLIIFEIMRSFFLGSKEQATNLAALHWWANARKPSARSPSVLAHYCTLTSIVFGFGMGRFGR
jgi:hypothetical protein